MFKKLHDGAASSQTPVRNKETKLLRESLLAQMPRMKLVDAAGGTPAFDKLFPSGAVESQKLGNGLIAYADSKEHIPMVIDADPKAGLGKGRLIPTVFALWRVPALLPHVVVYHPVSRAVLRGSAVMWPGILCPHPDGTAAATAAGAAAASGGSGTRAAGASPSSSSPVSLDAPFNFGAGAFVALRVLGNPLPFAVGTVAAAGPAILSAEAAAAAASTAAATSAAAAAAAAVSDAESDSDAADGAASDADAAPGDDAAASGGAPKPPPAVRVRLAAPRAVRATRGEGVAVLMHFRDGLWAAVAASPAGSTRPGVTVPNDGFGQVMVSPSAAATATATAAAEAAAAAAMPGVDDARRAQALTLAASVLTPDADPAYYGAFLVQNYAAAAAALAAADAGAASGAEEAATGGTVAGDADGAAADAAAALDGLHVADAAAPSSSASSSSTAPASSAPFWASWSQDDLVRACFYQFCKRHVADARAGAAGASGGDALGGAVGAVTLPLLASTFFGGNWLTRVRPSGAPPIMMKSTRWKKPGAFLRDMAAEGVVTLEGAPAASAGSGAGTAGSSAAGDPSGIVTIVAVNKAHPALKDFRTWALASEDGASGGGSGGADADDDDVGDAGAAASGVYQPPVLVSKLLAPPKCFGPVLRRVARYSPACLRKQGSSVPLPAVKEGEHDAVLVLLHMAGALPPAARGSDEAAALAEALATVGAVSEADVLDRLYSASALRGALDAYIELEMLASGGGGGGAADAVAAAAGGKGKAGGKAAGKKAASWKDDVASASAPASGPARGNVRLDVALAEAVTGPQHKDSRWDERMPVPPGHTTSTGDDGDAAADAAAPAAAAPAAAAHAGGGGGDDDDDAAAEVSKEEVTKAWAERCMPHTVLLFPAATGAYESRVYKGSFPPRVVLSTKTMKNKRAMTYVAGFEGLRIEPGMFSKDASRVCAASASVTTCGDAVWFPRGLHPATIPAVIIAPAPAAPAATAAAGGKGAGKGGGKHGGGGGGGKGASAASSSSSSSSSGSSSGGLSEALVVQAQGANAEALAALLTAPTSTGGYGLPKACVLIE